MIDDENQLGWRHRLPATDSTAATICSHLLSVYAQMTTELVSMIVSASLRGLLDTDPVPPTRRVTWRRAKDGCLQGRRLLPGREEPIRSATETMEFGGAVSRHSAASVRNPDKVQ